MYTTWLQNLPAHTTSKNSSTPSGQCFFHLSFTPFSFTTLSVIPSTTPSLGPFVPSPSHSSSPHHLTHHHHTISLITTTPSHSSPPPQHHSFHLSRIQTCLSCLLPPSTDPSVLHTSSLLCQRDFVLKLRQWFLQNASLGKLFFPSFHFFSLSLFLSFKSMNAAILFMILLHRIF